MDIEGSVIAPASELNKLRREIVEQLESQRFQQSNEIAKLVTMEE